MDYFEGKKAVVTGAAQGIGYGIATALYKHKAKVVAIDKNEKGLEQLKKEYPSIETITLVVSDWAETRRTFEAIEDIDLLVNNAAVGRDVPFLEITKQDIDALVNTNYLSVVNIMQVVGKSMKERRTGGSIVNVSSVLSSKLEMLGKSVYGATKAAVEKLTKAAAFELGQYKIRVNSVHPSTTKTPLTVHEVDNPEVATPLLNRTSLGKFCEVEDIVGPVLFLLNDNMSGLVHGESLFVDGGLN